MSRDWDYANMSKNAKLNGGPENYVKTIERGSEQKGMLEGSAITVFAGAAVYGTVKLVKFVVSKIKERTVSKKEVKVAEKKLIDGINEYDKEEEKSEDSPDNHE